MSNPIICVDFDGVIHSYNSGWKGVDQIPDEPVPGAIEWLMAHLPTPEPIGHFGNYIGPEVQIYSSRSKESSGIKAMQEWLIKHGLPKAYITDGVLKFPTQKPPAFLTIDDRAICFNGKFPTAEEMMSFKPWNKGSSNFPNGPLTATDEGKLQIAIGTEGDAVVLSFASSVSWFAMTPEMAIELASVMTERAKKILGMSEQ